MIARLVALLTLLTLVTTGFILPAAGAAGAGANAKRAKTACELITSAEIEGVLTAAPLEPGPRLRKIPNARKNLTNCAWDDERARDAAQLAVFTGLIRKGTPTQLRDIAVPSGGQPVRALTAEELTGLGDRGTVEIIRDGTYGTVAVVRGMHAYFVSAQYQGAGELPQVTEATMIELARLAAARLGPMR